MIFLSFHTTELSLFSHSVNAIPYSLGQRTSNSWSHLLAISLNLCCYSAYFMSKWVTNSILMLLYEFSCVLYEIISVFMYFRRLRCCMVADHFGINRTIWNGWLFQCCPPFYLWIVSNCDKVSLFSLLLWNPWALLSILTDGITSLMYKSTVLKWHFSDEFGSDYELILILTYFNGLYSITLSHLVGLCPFT